MKWEKIKPLAISFVIGFLIGVGIVTSIAVFNALKSNEEIKRLNSKLKILHKDLDKVKQEGQILERKRANMTKEIKNLKWKNYLLNLKKEYGND